MFLLVIGFVGYPLTKAGSGSKHAAAHPKTLKQKITLSLRSSARSFIRNLATEEDLKELEKLIVERRNNS
ncbi:hypothetical protein BpJC4_31050 [Weizmannia acidilactici]|nr:hypothetical protein BpJC4_31050 [Weizmannia acidilactici]GER75212.1 hypothetical protein BpPP18_32790 [Weizmannia acidilactici]